RAADAYERAIQIKPDARMLRNNRALALVELQKSDEAHEVLALALKLNPDDADLLDTQAMIEILDNHADKAIPLLEKLAAQSPDNPILRFHLAVAYNEAKDAKRAREAFLAATTLGVEQRLLSPRDRKTLADLKAHFTAPTAAVTEQPPANSSQVR